MFHAVAPFLCLFKVAGIELRSKRPEVYFRDGDLTSAACKVSSACF